MINSTTYHFWGPEAEFRGPREANEMRETVETNCGDARRLDPRRRELGDSFVAPGIKGKRAASQSDKIIPAERMKTALIFDVSAERCPTALEHFL